MYIMDHPNLTVSNFMGNSIFPKRAKESLLVCFIREISNEYFCK